MGWATEKALKDFLDNYINKNIIYEFNITNISLCIILLKSSFLCSTNHQLVDIGVKLIFL